MRSEEKCHCSDVAMAYRAEQTADLHEFPWVLMVTAAFASGPAKTNAVVKLRTEEIMLLKPR